MSDRKTTKWAPGTSGNPKGRQPGSGPLQKLREGIGEHVPAIIERLVLQAKDGDAQAARLLLERVLPPVKAIEQSVSLHLPVDGGLTAKADALLDAAASGDLAPGQAAALISAVGTVARISEVDDLAKRIARLEEAAQMKAQINGASHEAA